LKGILNRFPFLRRQRDCEGYDNHNESPEHELNMRFAGQAGACEGSFIEADEVPRHESPTVDLKVDPMR
jgi:hypothetical protein